MSCKEILLEKYGKEFSAKDIESILDHARAIIKKNKGVEDFNKLMEYVVKERVRYMEKKQQFLKQIEKKVYHDGRVDEMFDMDKVTEANAKDILESFLSRNGKFQQVSLESNVQAKYNEYMNMIYTLESMPEFALLRDGSATSDLNMQVVREIYNLSIHKKVSDKASPAVRKIAETLHAVNQKRLQDLQGAGFTIGELEGYIYSGAYDSGKIREMGMEAFFKKVNDSIDVEKTAEKWGIDLDSPKGKEEFDKLLKDIYETVSTKDTSMIHKYGIEEIFDEVNNPAKYDHAVSRSRSFVFKDADSFHTFFTETSGKNLLAAIHRDLRKSAKSVATADIFGTSPVIGKEFLFRKVNAKLLEAGKKPLSSAYKKRFDTLFDMVSGNASIGDSVVVSTASNVKKIVDMALLGKAAWKALFSDPMYTAAYQSTLSGDNYFASLVKSMTEFANNVVHPSRRKELSKRFGLIAANIQMETLDERTLSTGLLTRGLTSAHNFYMKATGLNFQATHARLANASMASMHLYDIFSGKVSKKQYDLDIGVLSRYGFSEQEIKILHLGKNKENGTGMLDPLTLRNADEKSLRAIIPDKKTISYLGESGKLSTKEVPLDLIDLRKIADKTATKLTAYLNDIALLGSPNPTKATQLMMSGMVDPSTPVGALMSLVTMYKGFGMSIYRVYRNIAWHDGVKDKNALVQYMFGGRGAMMYTMIGSMAGGGASLLMTDILDGKTPRDPSRPEFAAEAFMAGGAGGLLSDYFLENYEQGKKDIVRDLMGPAIGRMLPDMWELYGGIKKSVVEGDDKALQSTYMNISRWIPAQNLWLTNAFFGNMLLSKYREWADPKFEGRRRKQMREMSGSLWKQEQLIK